MLCKYTFTLSPTANCGTGLKQLSLIEKRCHIKLKFLSFVCLFAIGFHICFNPQWEEDGMYHVIFQVGIFTAHKIL